VLGGAGRAGAERWLSWLLQLKNNPQLFVRADGSIDVDRELKDGHVIMTFDWAHQLWFYRSLWGEHLGVAPLPRMSATDQPPRPYVKSDILAINGRVGASERRAAVEFLRFMVSVEAQQELFKSDIQPARQDLDLKLKADDATPDDQLRATAAQAFRDQAQQGQPMPNGPTRERKLLRDELEHMQQQVLMGEATPADAVTEADKRLREQLGLPNQ
jgi:maltose-binding protein MalE